MSIDDLMVPGATENPIDLEKLPESRPRVEMPITTKDDGPHTRKVIRRLFVIALFGSSFALYFLLGRSESTLAFLLNGCYLSCLFRPEEETFAEKVSRCFVKPFLWYLPLAAIYLSSGLGGLLALSLCLLLLLSTRFQRHYVHRATGGMLSTRVIEAVRGRGKFPKGLRSRSFVRGFFDDLVSFVSYNRNSVAAPGTLQSPAGHYRERLILTGAFILLFAYTSTRLCMGNSLAIESAGFYLVTDTDSFSVKAVIAVLAMIGCICVWLLAMFFSCMIYRWKRLLLTVLLSFLGGCIICAAPIPGQLAGPIRIAYLLLAVVALMGVCASSVRTWGMLYALKTKQMGPQHWRGFVDRLQSSPDAIERESIFLGTCDADNSPVFWPVRKIFHHGWVLGGSGSGKTSYLSAFLDQIIYRDDIATVFVDAKATSFEIFHSMLEAAAAAGKKSCRRVSVKHLTLDDGESTYLFTLFQQSWWQMLPSPQRAGVILSALALAYSRAYGQSYYTDSAYDLAHFVLERHPNIKSWAELKERIEEALRYSRDWELSPKTKQDGGHIQLVVKRLAGLSAINDYGHHPPSVINNAIDFSSAFQEPRHYYIAAGAIRNSLLAGEVGRLVAASVLNAAAALKKRPVRVLLVIDEFQEIVADSVQVLLSQARGLGVGVYLANQNCAQVITGTSDMRSVIEGNVALSGWMSVTDGIGLEQLRQLGGKRIVHLHSLSSRGDNQPTVTSRQDIVDRVSTTLVADVSADRKRFFLRLASNDGYAAYRGLVFVARSFFHQTKSAYEKACAMAWPAKSAETLVNGPPPKQGPPPPQPPQQRAPKPGPPPSPVGGAAAAKTAKGRKPRPKTPKINQVGRRTRVSTP